jgi:hypothetical protein
MLGAVGRYAYLAGGGGKWVDDLLWDIVYDSIEYGVNYVSVCIFNLQFLCTETEYVIAFTHIKGPLFFDVVYIHFLP